MGTIDYTLHRDTLAKSQMVSKMQDGFKNDGREF
jgi:hypothetical protein